MESIFDVFNIVLSGVWGKTTYSARNDIAFLLSTNGYRMLWGPPNFLCAFVFLWTKITTKFFQSTVPVHIYEFFVIIFIWWTVNVMNISIASELGSSGRRSSSKHSSFGLESISSSSPHSSSRLSPILSFSPFCSASYSFISFKTSSNDKTKFSDFLFDIFTLISLTISSKLNGNNLGSFKTTWSIKPSK